MPTPVPRKRPEPARACSLYCVQCSLPFWRYRCDLVRQICNAPPLEERWRDSASTRCSGGKDAKTYPRCARRVTKHGCTLLVDHEESILHGAELGPDRCVNGMRRREETWVLTLSRKTEQLFHDLQKKFLDNPAVQARLGEVRGKVAADSAFPLKESVYWLCREWGLEGGEPFVERVVRDPQSWETDTPVTALRSGQLPWYPWYITVSYLRDPDTQTESPPTVRATYSPLISPAEKRAADKAASKFLGLKAAKREGRPRLNAVERALLRREFLKYGPPAPRLRDSFLKEIHHALLAQGHQIAIKTIKREHGALLRAFGLPKEPRHFEKEVKRPYRS